MNRKKGEILTLIIILIGLTVAGFVLFEDKINIEKSKWIGDSSNKIIYNLESENPNCSLSEITINKTDIVFFKSIDSEDVKGYLISEDCY